MGIYHHLPFHIPFTKGIQQILSWPNIFGSGANYILQRNWIEKNDPSIPSIPQPTMKAIIFAAFSWMGHFHSPRKMRNRKHTFGQAVNFMFLNVTCNCDVFSFFFSEGCFTDCLGAAPMPRIKDADWQWRIAKAGIA